VLTLTLPKGNARIAFKAGEPVSVSYNGLTGEDAFFEIIRQKRGNFKFKPGLSPSEMNAPVIGDFMYLLMEGMNRVDQEQMDQAQLDLDLPDDPIILDDIC
jgi:CRP/FNR family transcriptional regulator, cyclic AMP receptor protein